MEQTENVICALVHAFFNLIRQNADKKVLRVQQLQISQLGFELEVNRRAKTVVARRRQR